MTEQYDHDHPNKTKRSDGIAEAQEKDRPEDGGYCCEKYGACAEGMRFGCFHKNTPSSQRYAIMDHFPITRPAIPDFTENIPYL